MSPPHADPSKRPSPLFRCVFSVLIAASLWIAGSQGRDHLLSARPSARSKRVRVQGRRIHIIAGSEKRYRTDRSSPTTTRQNQQAPLKAARLARPSRIQNLYLTGWVSFYRSGRVRTGKLGRNQRIHKHRFKADTRFSLYPSGRPSYGSLVKDRTLEGYPLRGYPKTTYFYKSGKLRSGYLSRRHKAHGVSLKAKSLFEVHPDGRLKSGTLATDQTAGRGKGRFTLPKDSRGYFDSKGRLRSAFLSQATRIQGLLVGGKSHSSKRVRFHASGKLLMATTAKKQRLGGEVVPKNTTV